MNDDPQHPASRVILQVGDALNVADYDGAITALSHAKGDLLPPIAGRDEDDDPANPPGPVPRQRRKRKPSPLDPSGYPRVASLSQDQVAALVSACWARCHGRAIVADGRLRALRALLPRQLVEVAPESMSGNKRAKWFAATQLGALVILKALLRGSPAVARAVQQELRS